jgi:hypothetical protein
LGVEWVLRPLRLQESIPEFQPRCKTSMMIL